MIPDILFASTFEHGSSSSTMLLKMTHLNDDFDLNVNDDLNDDFVKDVFDFNVSDNLYDNSDSDVNDDLIMIILILMLMTI